MARLRFVSVHEVAMLSTRLLRAEVTMPRPRPAVTPRDVWCQAKADWLGKEVQTGYTYTYIWMANQVGHFMLGLAPVLLADWAGQAVWNWQHDAPTPPFPHHWVYGFAAALAGLWFAKEAYDVIVAENGVGREFRVNGGDLWKDAFTALYFFWSGIITASLSFRRPDLAVLSFLILLAIAVVVPGWYWLSRKLCFQRGQFPFLARLADFTSGFGSGDGRLGRDEINAFVALDGPGIPGQVQHLLIFGAAGTGRSTLAVAMGTEHTFKVRPARYMTWTKFLDLDNANKQEDSKRVWPWREADILFLDDVFERSVASSADAINEVASEIRSLKLQTRQELSKLRVVWVLGPLMEAPGPGNQWCQMFATCLGPNPPQFGIVEVTGGYTRLKVPISSLSGH